MVDSIQSVSLDACDESHSAVPRLFFELCYIRMKVLLLLCESGKGLALVGDKRTKRHVTSVEPGLQLHL